MQTKDGFEGGLTLIVAGLFEPGYIKVASEFLPENLITFIKNKEIASIITLFVALAALKFLPAIRRGLHGKGLSINPFKFTPEQLTAYIRKYKALKDNDETLFEESQRLDRFEQQAKVGGLIERKMALLRLLQSLNALSPIEVTLSGIITLIRLSLPVNTLPSIDVTV